MRNKKASPCSCPSVHAYFISLHKRRDQECDAPIMVLLHSRSSLFGVRSPFPPCWPKPATIRPCISITLLPITSPTKHSSCLTAGRHYKKTQQIGHTAISSIVILTTVRYPLGERTELQLPVCLKDSLQSWLQTQSAMQVRLEIRFPVWGCCTSLHVSHEPDSL